MTRNPPPTSPAPNPSSIFMPPTTSSSPSSSSGTGPERRPDAMAATTTAEPTPLPPRRPLSDDEEPQHHQQNGQEESSNHKDDDDTFPLPKLRLHVQDAMHPGAARFLAAVDAPALLSRSVQTVLRLLYVSPHKHRAHDDDNDDSAAGSPAGTRTRRPSRPHYTPPPTRSVTLFLEDMDGVAYTKGTDLDGDHKEIHLSLGYVKGIRRAAPAILGDAAGAYEIEGVLVHELVHCFQHNGRGACPGGLVEGIADWVRLGARLGPPHWRRDAVPDRWDQGYERTAYFLDWLEGRFGRGTVRRMNEALRVREYKESEFWTGLFGHEVDVLWEEYLKTLKKGGRD
ncbi:hypothetical protein KVR01_003180 [Diaporthe batatas]|uniref:uncharacterized protein n=1 Tax=Diaporthe batatas TaxID=748121 RepID=UPI001D057869|nr:uncharacterized protein KVR01_003180 [Diaporthe batatas]KAG8167491.1 hypothetical protein KVR01_003180 [Diaporthe batatas]